MTNRNADVLSNHIHTKLCVLWPTESANHETTQLIINSHFYFENEYSTSCKTTTVLLTLGSGRHSVGNE